MLCSELSASWRAPPALAAVLDVKLEFVMITRAILVPTTVQIQTLV